MHQLTKQKLLDTPSIDINIQPHSLTIDENGRMIVEWKEKNDEIHRTVYNSDWLLRYGQCFIQENFACGEDDNPNRRPPMVLWDRTTIWNNFPEISFQEFMESKNGLTLWLEMFHRFGIAILRGVPATKVCLLLNDSD